MRQASRATLGRWLLVAPAVAVALGVLLPLLWLVLKASEVELDQLREIVFRPRTWTLLGNTVGLAVAVVAGSLSLGLPLAWLVTRTDLRGKGWVTLLAVLPLAVPGYVMAYALSAVGGPRGAASRLLGWEVATPDGFWGAALALTLYNFPYAFLMLRATLRRLDRGPSEAARTLGLGPWAVLWRIQLPLLLPAVLGTSILVGLYVVGDFGVVSLMRFDTLSYALYLNWSDARYAAWLALLLIAVAAVILAGEAVALRGTRVARVGSGVSQSGSLVRLGAWSLLVWLGVALVIGLAVILPVLTTLYWLSARRSLFVVTDLVAPVVDSLSVALPAAALTLAVGVPLAWLAHRHRTFAARASERVAQLGYALPPLALALGLVFVAIRVAPAIRETLLLLIAAYVIHFLLLGMGPVRATLHLFTPRHEEAARALGCGPLETLWRVTLPALRVGVIAGAVLVFLAVMKELPLARLLAPLDFNPLAVAAWSRADESLYAEAAPYAASLLLVSGATVGLVLSREGGR